MSEEFGTSWDENPGMEGTFDLETGEPTNPTSPWDNESLEGWDQEVDLVCNTTNEACMNIIDEADNEPYEPPTMEELFGNNDEAANNYDYTEYSSTGTNG